MIARALRLNWRFLPAHLRKTAANVAIMRAAVLGYVALIAISLGQRGASTDVAGFLDAVLTLNTVSAVAALIAGFVLVPWRAMVVAPRFIEAYAEMMPENADEIREMFQERGVADVIAPWVMTRPGRLKGVMTRIARRFSIVP